MRQLPVYSPLTLGGLVAGMGAAFGDRADVARDNLTHALQQRFAADAVHLTDSGTSALAVAITAACHERRDAAVALPAYCCYDVATAAAAADAPVVLYDLDPATLGPDWGSFERALKSGASAAVVAHLFGLPVDMHRAAALCEARGAVLIEDAAQGAGGRFDGKPLGAWSTLSVLSFGRGKGVTGGGGALLARRDGVDRVATAANSIGRASGSARALVLAGAQWLLGRPSLYGLPAALPFLRLGETVYREPHAPRGLAGGAAAVVLDSLRWVDAEAVIRRANAHQLEAVVRDAGLTVVEPPPRSEPGFLRLPVVVDAGVAAASAAALGIARGYPLALTDLPQLARRRRDGGEPTAAAARLAQHLWTLPTHSRLTAGDLDRVERWLRRAVKQ